MSEDQIDQLLRDIDNLERTKSRVAHEYAEENNIPIIDLDVPDLSQLLPNAFE
jgi:O-methyltransferase involved in polyketide biosynthesis